MHKLIILFSIFMCQFLLCWCREFRIAWMAPHNTYHGLNASSSVGGLKLALQAISLRGANLLKNHTVRVKWYDSDCNQKSALAAVVTAKYNFEPDVFIGPPCSAAMVGVAHLASFWRRPIFGWVSNDIQFRNKTIFSTLIRLLGPLNNLRFMMRYVSKMFKWTRYSMIHDEAAPYKSVATAIAENKDIMIKSTHEVSVNMKNSDIESLFKQVRKYSRILIFAVPWNSLRRYLVVAHSLGMSNGDFAFLCVHGDVYSWKQLNEEVLSENGWRRNDSDDHGARLAFESVLHIILPTLSKEISESFSTAVRRLKNEKENVNWINLPSVTEPDAYAPYLYDATLTWAIIVNKMLAEKVDPSDGDLMFKKSVNFFRQGLTDIIKLDEQGDRALNFWMLDLQEDGRFERIAEIKVHDNGVFVNTTQKEDRLVRWANGKYGIKNAPKDVPICGFENEHCREDFTPTILAAVCGSSALVVIAIVINIIFRRYRRVQFLKSLIWQIRFEDIDFVTALLHGSVRNSFKTLTRRRTSSNKKKASRSNSANPNGAVIPANSSPPQFHKPDNGAMFGSVAYVRGSLVSVKREQRSNITMTKVVLLQLNQLMELKHQNVCAFVGASFDPGRVLLLWEYCPKGSIQDVIGNENIKLDQMFKFALSLDIVKGLDFIHKSCVQFHGNLKSSNCVVDSRWTCKLTDFGVPAIRFSDRNILEDYPEKQLWTAPEVLRNEKYIDRQKADLYSLGIILKEVFTRSGPYTEFTDLMTASEIIQKVKVRASGKATFRPLISVEYRNKHPELVNLIDELWHEDSQHRMTASRAYKTLHRINPSKNLTMIDNMIAILEKYANHLEDLVAERTSELDVEKKRAENLLYRMLPRSVAEELKAGKQVKAEHFDEATIYFSDIVGFTTICASSTPIEVVYLLNCLYTLFDDIITRYDVYKVETIGDAYMLASGLPTRNGSQHIKYIADCALDILESIKTFYIPHQENQAVRIRIGIHSGSVVAGVVGMAMPRYCLFGDTVNTASRMESTGLPMKIHLSTAAAEKLQKFQNYSLECRGEINVKGKGIMKTYFLNGKSEDSQSMPLVKETRESTTSVKAEPGLSHSTSAGKMRHISTVSNAIEGRVGIGHYGDIPDIIHKCKSRPSLQSILTIDSVNFHPVRRSSSSESSQNRKISTVSGHTETDLDLSERTTSLESGYFPADSSCSSIERNSPCVNRVHYFDKHGPMNGTVDDEMNCDGKDVHNKSMDPDIKRSKDRTKRKDNIFSVKYFPQKGVGFDENKSSVDPEFFLDEGIHKDMSSNILSNYCDDELSNKLRRKLERICSVDSGRDVCMEPDCLKNCIACQSNLVDENAKWLNKNNCEKSQDDINVNHEQLNNPDPDLLPFPEQRVRRRSKTMTTEVTAL